MITAGPEWTSGVQRLPDGIDDPAVGRPDEKASLPHDPLFSDPDGVFGPAPLDQLGFDSQLLLDGSRRTGGFRVELRSDRAVADGNLLHGSSLPR